MHPLALSQSVANLRKSRLWAERDLSISREIAAVADETRRAAKSALGVGATWAMVCPSELVAHTKVESLQRSLLTVAVDDASARYLLDRWLRGGGEAEVVRASGPAVRKVKLVSARGDGVDAVAGRVVGAKKTRR